ncbi:MAG: GNAT family N-acetyltransferase [Rhodospirillales bacterium]|jgi:GNAT superfamily N-acetyltransferase|nr:GNAT family N-acetyltransferase [Rhodospirillales bacterium]
MINLRIPHLDELPELSELCMRSKAVWGYDKAFMDACREELTIAPEGLKKDYFQLAEDTSGILGVAQIAIKNEQADLELLFIDPDKMGMGAGRILFEWATEKARSLGGIRMIIDADPEAAPFYIHMGAREIGKTASVSIPGRMLPQLEYTLS